MEEQMTVFNPENKKELSFDESNGPAMKIIDAKDAAQYKAAYIAYTEKGIAAGGVNKTGITAEEIVNSNLGYFAGYYSNEVRERVETLFNCEHPIFGSIKKNGAPTSAEAFRMGLVEGAKHQKS